MILIFSLLFRFKSGNWLRPLLLWSIIILCLSLVFLYRISSIKFLPYFHYKHIGEYVKIYGTFQPELFLTNNGFHQIKIHYNADYERELISWAGKSSKEHKYIDEYRPFNSKINLIAYDTSFVRFCSDTLIPLRMGRTKIVLKNDSVISTFKFKIGDSVDIDTLAIFVKNMNPPKGIENWFGKSHIYGTQESYLLYNGKYAIAVWQQSQDNNYHIVAYKLGLKNNSDTIYILSTDKELVKFEDFGKWPQGIDDNYLLMDFGCCPGPRGLMIIDLSTCDTILNTSYTEIDHYDTSKILTYYCPFRPATKKDCDKYDEYKKEGLEPYIEQLYSFDLRKKIETGLDKFRCEAYN